MLRLCVQGLTAAPKNAVPQIVRDYNDAYVELIRLLYEASNVEHALLVQYLAAAFSIKPAYSSVAGNAMGPNAFSLFGVAIQEMRHLDVVNRLLVAVDATPRLDREDFPIQTAIYPFRLEILPLSEQSVARYVYAEAPASVFDPGAAPADKALADRVLALLGHQHVNHLGGLYTNIISRLSEVMAAPPSGLADLSDFPDELEAIKEQGEGPHYLFFRSLLEGTAPDLHGADTWKNPANDAYPSLPLCHGFKAFSGDPKAIPDEDARKIAWLADLHYWLTLSLLDMGYRFGNDTYDYIGASMAHMRGPIYQLGFALGSRGYCMPFDLPTLPVPWSTQEAGCRLGVSRLAQEAKNNGGAIAALLPPTFTSDAVDATIELLNG